MQMLWFIIHTVSTPLAGATRPHTEPHVLGALCRAASTHAEVASFTELQPLDSSYRPVSTYLTGATRSHAGPQVLAFMEMVLQILSGIKQTQQAQSQYLNELLSNANSAPYNLVTSLICLFRMRQTCLTMTKSLRQTDKLDIRWHID
ncbi:uncharacterized protein LOC142585216 isoform X2 [Dermacentor variabilis]